MAGTYVLAMKCGAGQRIWARRMETTMPKSKGTRTAWCVAEIDEFGDPIVMFAEANRFGDIRNHPRLEADAFEAIFGWLPSPDDKPVEVRLERVHRRQTGAPRTARKSRARKGGKKP